MSASSHDPDAFLGLDHDTEDSRLEMVDALHCRKHPKQHLEPFAELEDGRLWYYCLAGGNVLVVDAKARNVIVCPSVR